MVKPTALIVLDGWGYREGTEHNAIAEAKTPFFDHLQNTYPHSYLDASEHHVGLPGGQMGNSEIGHMTIGAGFVIETDLVRIGESIKNGSFEVNPALQHVLSFVRERSGTLHLIGMIGPGGVHSHGDHLIALLNAAKQAQITRVAIHAITDGRDVSPRSAEQYIQELHDVMTRIGIGSIVTVAGRFYAMDRDQHWDRVDSALHAITGDTAAPRSTHTVGDIVRQSYEQGITDEYIVPTILSQETGPFLHAADGVILFNFRADRMRMITKRLLDLQESVGFALATMTEYDETFSCPVLFPPIDIPTTLAAEVSNAHCSQAHIAETEKYAHATYFLNGGREQPHPGEEHILIESRKDVRTHDEAPEMRATEIADTAVKQLAAGKDFLFINFANADMVGHTANRPAVVKAIETVDAALKTVIEAVLSLDGVAIITADHGNAETNIDPDTKEQHTAHTTNRVPFIVTRKGITLDHGTLADVAPTTLALMGLPIPQSMTGKSLVQA